MTIAIVKTTWYLYPIKPSKFKANISKIMLDEIPNIPINEFHCPKVIPMMINKARAFPYLRCFLKPNKAVSFVMSA